MLYLLRRLTVPPGFSDLHIPNQTSKENAYESQYDQAL